MFKVNNEDIPRSSVSIVNFEHVITCWDIELYFALAFGN